MIFYKSQFEDVKFTLRYFWLLNGNFRYETCSMRLQIIVFIFNSLEILKISMFTFNQRKQITLKSLSLQTPRKYFSIHFVKAKKKPFRLQISFSKGFQVYLFKNKLHLASGFAFSTVSISLFTCSSLIFISLLSLMSSNEKRG